LTIGVLTLTGAWRLDAAQSEPADAEAADPAAESQPPADVPPEPPLLPPETPPATDPPNDPPEEEPDEPKKPPVEPSVVPANLPAMPFKFAPAAEVTAASLKEESLVVARRVMDDFPEDPNGLLAAGIAHRRNGSTADAVKCWKAALKLAPNRADVHDALGTLHLQKEEYDAAVAMFEEALLISPRTAGVNHRLAEALMGQGELHRAATALREELRLVPAASGSRLLLGQVYRQLGEHERAVAIYEAAVTLDPELTDAYSALATLYARLDRPAESQRYTEMFESRKSEERKEHVEQRSETDDLDVMRSTTAETCTNVGKVYARYGFGENAETLWRRAAALDAEHTLSREILVSWYNRLGKKAEMRQLCQELIAIDPENPNYQRLVTLLEKADEKE